VRIHVNKVNLQFQAKLIWISGVAAAVVHPLGFAMGVAPVERFFESMK
jgi:hypothetical protein